MTVSFENEFSKCTEPGLWLAFLNSLICVFLFLNVFFIFGYVKQIDYFFEKEYQLPTLSEVEKFIEQNGHLPNVPSREEVLKDGVDVGEMLKILTEKVEELTLYSIELQKRIKELEKTKE